jgi:uncharacterized membrane protein YphA (DoxX/SURF4 family)
MRNPLKTEAAASLGLLLARLPIGVLFLILGFNKLHGGVDTFVSNTRSTIPSWAPPEAGLRYLQLIPYLEVSVGALLVLGLLTRLAGLVGALMVISFTVAVTGMHDANFPFHPNLVFIGILLTLFFVGPGKLSLDGLFFSKSKRLAHPE